MKKRDLTKLALMGLASGCFMAAQAPEVNSASENQVIEENFSQYLARCPGGSCSANQNGRNVYSGESSSCGSGNWGGVNGNGDHNSCGSASYGSNGSNQKNRKPKSGGNGRTAAYPSGQPGFHELSSCGSGTCGSSTNGNNNGNNNGYNNGDSNGCGGPNGCGTTPGQNSNPGYSVPQQRRQSLYQKKSSQQSPNRTAQTIPQPQQDQGKMFPMSEKMLMPALNDDAKARYLSMPPEGKALALKKASDDQAYPDKNRAVLDAYREMQTYQKQTNQDGKLKNGLQTPEELEKHQREMQMERLRQNMRERLNQQNPSY